MTAAHYFFFLCLFPQYNIAYIDYGIRSVLIFKIISRFHFNQEKNRISLLKTILNIKTNYEYRLTCVLFNNWW